MAEVKQIEELKKPNFRRLPLNNDGTLIKNAFGIRSPKNIVIVKYPKSGGTLAMCNVPKILILDAEDGTDYFAPDNVAKLIDRNVDKQFVSTNKYGWLPKTIFDIVDELSTANNMDEYWVKYNALEDERDLKKKEVLYNELIEFINKMPFPIVAIDTITSIQKLSNDAALHEYNLGVKESSQKADIKRVDEYGGVQYIRRKFSEIKSFIEQNAAPFIQYHGHIAFKKKVLKKGEEEMNALDIALEGVLSTSFTAKADAVCSLIRDEKGVWVDFTKKEETDLGSRPLHLSNKKVKIADLVKPNEIFPKTYWNELYPEIKF
jgi:hypothetical protein